MTRMAPLGMGATMGVMMPFMVHGLGAGAIIWFVLAHVAIALGVAISAIVVVRWIGRSPAWLRVHKPSLHHVGQMLCGAGLGFGVLHVFAHGLGAA